MRSTILTVAIAAGVGFAPTIAEAQVYSGNKWEISSRAYVTNHAFFSNEQLAFARAMNTWNTIGPGFRYVDGGFSSYNADGTTCGDSTSGIAPSYVPTGATAAITRTCYSGSSIRDSDLLVNYQMLDAGTFYAGTGSPTSTQVDMESMALHEFGHSLRLLHDSSYPSTVMYDTLSKGAVKRVLTSRDRTGKATLYP